MIELGEFIAAILMISGMILAMASGVVRHARLARLLTAMSCGLFGLAIATAILTLFASFFL
ncbi:MAG TPA: hypothetical protein VK797_28020 [Tepidisphaeraceae bacterium]|jgi:hypothetical protein|nr:hypothetical protein [Tepidisphaeraceae bacterium]